MIMRTINNYKSIHIDTVKNISDKSDVEKLNYKSIHIDTVKIFLLRTE